jgi:hypothetical protein
VLEQLHGILLGAANAAIDERSLDSAR